VSIVLAIFAILQAWMIFRWSTESAKEAKRSADSVGESVRKLEDVFERLYTDHSSMMRDTVHSTLEHLWLILANERMSGQSKVTPEVEERTTQIRDAVQGTIRAQLVRAIGEAQSRNYEAMRAHDLLGPLIGEFKAEAVHSVLAGLRGEGLVDWDGTSEWVQGPDIPVRLLSSGAERR
jgi:hypothetical protein